MRAAGPTEFEDLETGARIIADPTTLRSSYEEAFRSFLSDVQHAIEREGLDYLRLTTSEPLEPALRRLLIRRRGGVSL